MTKHILLAVVLAGFFASLGVGSQAEASSFFRRRLGTACEQSIKTSAVDNELVFAETGNAEIDQAVTAANLRLKKKQTQNLLLSETKTHDLVKTSMVTPLDGDNHVERLVDDIMLAQDTPKWPLVLEMTITLKNAAGGYTVLSQTTNYDPRCRENIVETVSQNLRVSGHTLYVKATELNPVNGRPEVTENTAALPAGARFLPAMPFTYAAKEMRELFTALTPVRTFVFGSPTVPLVELVTKPHTVTVRFNPLTAAYEVLSSLTVESFIDGRLTATNVVSFSKANEYSEDVDGAGVREFTVPKKIWTSRILSGTVDNLSSVSFEDGVFKDGYSGPIAASLTVNDELTYDNLGAYWTTKSEQMVNDGKTPAQYIYTIVARQEPLTKDSVALSQPASENSAPFLKSTEYVQSNLPEIQSAVKKLEKNFTGTRIEMAQKILKYLPKVIEFDDGMIDDNEIVALKTALILERGKGVCQHFANVFAALARAAGIPTRIVSGFTFEENTVFGHAWNEIEVQDGVWLPIEPQYEHVFDMAYWQYLPLAVSAELDDPTRKDDLVREDWILANFVFSLKQVESR